MQEKSYSIMMEDKAIGKLLNRVTIKKTINLHFGGDTLDDDSMKKTLQKIKVKREKDYYIDVNIDVLLDSGEELVNKLIEIINGDLSKKQFKYWIHEGMSIEHVLSQLSENLDRPALISFYQFRNPDSEKEKVILTDLRKFVEMRDSFLLGILIISSQEIGDWDLSPYSNLDERYLEYFPHTAKKYIG